MTAADGSDLTGTDRFEIREHLGSGGFGDVFRAWDRKLETMVALKTLHGAAPEAVYRFKREFRALADLVHPNLVKLYELQSERRQWFFTMELVEGCDFIAYVGRSSPARRPSATTHTLGRRGGDAAGFATRAVLEGSEPPPEAAASEATWSPDLGRLRSGFRQLAAGLGALHAAGKLHRDVKPSNIRVTAEGRVVLLDFGLIKDLRSVEEIKTLPGTVFGTPAYMAPEQVMGEAATAASDWYSAGVVLYRALTGRLPFPGGVRHLQDKLGRRAPSPSATVPGLPADLGDLCRGLLARDPDRRPAGARVLARLGVAPPAGRSADPAAGDEGAFVGRRRELRTLDRAFAASRGGRAAIALVDGGSGIGKTALIHRWSERLRRDHPRAVLFKGRCYERETVPYKALDPLMDHLCYFLTRLPGDQVEALLPADVWALARLFPALHRVPAVTRTRRPLRDLPDRQEQKRRARAALRQLLAGLVARRPVVLYIDDLQWGDAESADLVAELLQPPDPLPVLLILCYRSEELEDSVFLRRLRSSRFISDTVKLRQIAVGELSPEDALELARRLLGDRAPATPTLGRKIAEESGGNPFFVAELVRLAERRLASGGDQRRVPGLAGGMTLRSLIESRLRRLPREAGRLLEVTAVAGRPVDLNVAVQAAGLAGEPQEALTELRASKLARIRRSGPADEIETYHDRIRETVVGALDGSLKRSIHRRLAAAMEASERATASIFGSETLAAHYREAGDREAEARFLIVAGDRAAEALAFERAASLYRAALDLGVHGRSEGRRLEVRLGDALANAGRGAAAAAAYLAAVPEADLAAASELRRRAAEQQLRSGHLEEGLETIRRVLEANGMSLPRSRAAALASLVLQRLRLRLRGLAFTAADGSRVPAEQLARIDVCSSVAIGLSNVDPPQGMDFATRHLLLALDAGEPFRLAHAFTLEAGFSSLGGTRTRARTARLIATATELAQQIDHPYAIGLCRMAAGLAAYLEGRGRPAVEIWQDAEELLRGSCTGVAWELASLMHYKYRALVFLGRLRTVLDELPAVLRELVDRGDLYGECSLRSIVGYFALLAEDRPQEAETEIRRSSEQWTREGFHMQHLFQLIGRVETALYRRDGAAAWSLVEEAWPALVRSQLLRMVELSRTELLHLRCRGALAGLAVWGSGSVAGKAVSKVLRRDLRRLGRQTCPWAVPFAGLIRAGLAAGAGDRERAVDLLATAAAGFDAVDMALYAAVSRRRRGQLLGGDEGRRRVAAADAWMAGQGVRRVERMADTLAPGRWQSAS